MTKTEQLSHQIIEFYERISSWEHEVVKDSGLSPAQMHTIEIVGHAESLQMKDLAKKMGVTTGTITVMVDRLEKQGLLIRKQHETDRRSYRVELTEKGRELFIAHHRFHLGLTEEILARLTPEEQQTFGAVLTKICGLL